MCTYHNYEPILCEGNLQQISSGDCPGPDEALEPLACVSLFQQSRQHHLQQQQLQGQLAHRGITTAVARGSTVTTTTTSI